MEHKDVENTLIAVAVACAIGGLLLVFVVGVLIAIAT